MRSNRLPLANHKLRQIDLSSGSAITKSVRPSCCTHSNPASSRPKGSVGEIETSRGENRHHEQQAHHPKQLFFDRHDSLPCAVRPGIETPAQLSIRRMSGSIKLEANATPMVS